MKRYLTILITFAMATNASAQEEAADQSLTTAAEDLADEATLFPTPQYQGDLGTREALTGDWGGGRTALAENNGLQFEVDVNQYYFGNWSGGRDQKSDYYGTADYRIKFDSGRAGLWPGGFIEVHGESYWGQTVDSLSGAILPVNTDAALSLPAGNGTYLPHVVYTQFISDTFAVFLGSLDTTVGDANRFAHGNGTERFMNLGFSFNPVTLQTTPYSTLGAGFLVIPSENVTFSVSIFDADGSIDQTGFDTVFDGNTSLSAELGISTEFFDRSGHHTFGFVGSNKDFIAVDQDPRILIPVLDLEPNVESGSWAFYYNFDQFLVSDPSDPNQGWGLFGRVGVSDGKANPIHRFYSAGFGGVGIIPGRDRDSFGAGYYYLELSNNRPGLLTDDNEQGVEVFYNFAVTPWFEVTADMQIVDGAGRFSDTAVLGGIRARLVF